MLTRRTLIGTLPVLSLWPLVARSADESPLIYLSPIRSDGNLSRCQAEVWFVGDGTDYFVVTAHDAWRAQAVSRGLTRARVWVGDVGQWRSSDGRYKDLPSVLASVTREDDPTQHARILSRFGDKYTDEWGAWGPRFKRGLADGSRVMLRYRPV